MKVKALAILCVFVGALGCDGSGQGGTAGAGGGAGTGGGGAGGASGVTFMCPSNQNIAQCKHGQEYCSMTTAGSVSCMPLPTTCGAAPSCACIPTWSSCDSCSQSAAGDIQFVMALDCTMN